MERKLVENLLAVQELAKKDETYLSLLAEYWAADGRFLRVLEEMASQHRDAVMDYIGAVHAVNQRLLELALSSAENC